MYFREILIERKLFSEIENIKIEGKKRDFLL